MFLEKTEESEMGNDERVILDVVDAMAMLPEGDRIHTFRGPGILIGADWDREDIVNAIKKYGAELSGAMATALGHGLALNDGSWLFIETSSERGER